MRRAATLSCSFLCRPHHNVTGGMKCLVEHIRLLRGRGHCLVAVHRSDSATTAMPPWSEVQADKDIVCGLHQRLGDVYPLADIDVVVVGIFHQVGPVKPSMSWRLALQPPNQQWVWQAAAVHKVNHMALAGLLRASLGPGNMTTPEMSLTSSESLTVRLHWLTGGGAAGGSGGPRAVLGAGPRVAVWGPRALSGGRCSFALSPGRQ